MNTQLLLVLPQKRLCVVGSIKGSAIRAASRTSVVPTNDEVGTPVVLTNDRVPHGLARSSHAHRKREQGQSRSILRIVAQQGLIAPHSGVVIYIPGFRHTNGWMNQQIGSGVPRRAQSQFQVDAMHGVPGLEGNDLRPSEAQEFGAQVGGS